MPFGSSLYRFLMTIGVTIPTRESQEMNWTSLGIDSWSVSHWEVTVWQVLQHVGSSARGFRLPLNEAARLNLNSSVALQPGDDFATILGATHNLHCLVSHAFHTTDHNTNDVQRGGFAKLYSRTTITPTLLKKHLTIIDITIVSSMYKMVAPIR